MGRWLKKASGQLLLMRLRLGGGHPRPAGRRASRSPRVLLPCCCSTTVLPSRPRQPNGRLHRWVSGMLGCFVPPPGGRPLGNRRCTGQVSVACAERSACLHCRGLACLWSRSPAALLPASQAPEPPPAHVPKEPPTDPCAVPGPAAGRLPCTPPSPAVHAPAEAEPARPARPLRGPSAGQHAGIGGIPRGSTAGRPCRDLAPAAAAAGPG